MYRHDFPGDVITARTEGFLSLIRLLTGGIRSVVINKTAAVEVTKW